MTRLSPLHRRNLRRRRPRPIVHWQHLIGVCLVALPLAVWAHRVNSSLNCDPTTFEACR